MVTEKPNSPAKVQKINDIRKFTCNIQRKRRKETRTTYLGTMAKTLNRVAGKKVFIMTEGKIKIFAHCGDKKFTTTIILNKKAKDYLDSHYSLKVDIYFGNEVKISQSSWPYDVLQAAKIPSWEGKCLDYDTYELVN